MTAGDVSDKINFAQKMYAFNEIEINLHTDKKPQQHISEGVRNVQFGDIKL